MMGMREHVHWLDFDNDAPPQVVVHRRRRRFLHQLLMAPLEAEYPADPPLDEVTGIILLGGWEGGFSDELPLLPQLNDAGDRLLAAAMLARRLPEATHLILAFIGVGATRGDTAIYEDESGVVAGGVGGRWLFRPEDSLWIGIDVARRDAIRRRRPRGRHRGDRRRRVSGAGAARASAGDSDFTVGYIALQSS